MRYAYAPKNTPAGTSTAPMTIARHAGGPVEQVLLAGVGHVPHREQPEQVLARIAQFLRPVS